MSSPRTDKTEGSFEAAKLIVAENIKAYRKVAELSQEGLAHKMGTIQSNISKLEAGRGNPTLETLSELADSLGVPVSALFIR